MGGDVELIQLHFGVIRLGFWQQFFKRKLGGRRLEVRDVPNRIYLYPTGGRMGMGTHTDNTQHPPTHTSQRRTIHAYAITPCPYHLQGDSRAGRKFEIFMLWTIVIAVVMFALSTEETVVDMWGTSAFDVFEWVVTVLFTVEYALRIYAGMLLTF